MTNNKLKYELFFHSNGSKWFEQYYDEKGFFHNDHGHSDYQQWYENGFLFRKTFCINGEYYNICNPAVIWLSKNVKIEFKYYYIDGLVYNKLDWQNKIKNV